MVRTVHDGVPQVRLAGGAGKPEARQGGRMMAWEGCRWLYPWLVMWWAELPLAGHEMGYYV